MGKIIIRRNKTSFETLLKKIATIIVAIFNCINLKDS